MTARWSTLRWIATILVVGGAWQAGAQTMVDLSRQGKLGSGTVLPAQCAVGQAFLKTNAPAGANVYTCTSSNSWSVVGISAAGAGIVVNGGSIAVEDAVVPVYHAGSGAPTINCTTGRDFYVDTVSGTLHFCKATNVWQATSNREQVVGVNDTGTMALVEEFSSLAGTHGWEVANLAGGCTQVWEGSFSNRPGIVGLRASGANGGCAWGLNGMVPALAGLTWTAKWSWSSESAFGSTNLLKRVGLGSSTGANPPADGVFVKLLAGTDTNWQYELYSGGALVGAVDSGVAYSADSRYTASYRGDGSKWYMAISTNGGAFSAERSICPSGCSINGTLPAVALGPVAQIVHTATVDGAVKRLYVDRFSISIAGLVR